MEFQARDVNYKARVAESFDAQSAMRSMGITLISVDPGQIVLAKREKGRFLQQQGFMHGGVISAGLDSACGFAALSLTQPSSEVLTIEFKAAFFYPAKTVPIHFVGKVLKSGRRVCFCESEAWEMDGKKPKLIAKMSSSLAVVDMPPGWRPAPSHTAEGK